MNPTTNPTMNPQNAQLLAQLQDIQLPDPVGWWPLAFTWWVLLLSLGAMLLALIWFWIERRRRNAYRREALQQLQQLINQPSADSSAQQATILQINALLKQVAITVYGRAKVAPLNGQAWLDFLKTNAEFIAQPQELLDCLQLAYQNAAETESRHALRVWQDYAKQWIRGHHL